MTTYTLPGDGEHIIRLPQYYDGHAIDMSGAGSAVVEAQYPGGDAWYPVPNSPLTEGKILRFTGVVDRLRFTVTGSSGPIDVHWFDYGGGQGLDYQGPETRVAPSPAMAAGVEAFIVQPYSESNVKRGLEFYFRAAYPTADPIVGATPRKILFQTGSKSVLVKLRVFEYVGEELQIELFANPTGVTGGTAVTPSNWNRINPQASTVTVTKDVATTTDGTTFESQPEYFFGASTQPSRDVASIPQGRERVLPPNTDFLVVITNNDGEASARCQYFLDWYEGEPDIPQ